MDNCKLYIGNLEWNITEVMLKAEFSKIGEVESVSIIIDRETGRSRGFGFIVMATPEQAKKAIESLNHFKMNNRSIFVREARPEGSQPTAYVDDMDKFVNTAQIHEQLNFKVGEKEFSLVREF